MGAEDAIHNLGNRARPGLQIRTDHLACLMLHRASNESRDGLAGLRVERRRAQRAYRQDPQELCSGGPAARENLLERSGSLSRRSRSLHTTPPRRICAEGSQRNLLVRGLPSRPARCEEDVGAAVESTGLVGQLFLPGQQGVPTNRAFLQCLKHGGITQRQGIRRSGLHQLAREGGEQVVYLAPSEHPASVGGVLLLATAYH